MLTREQRKLNLLAAFSRLAVEPMVELSGAREYGEDGTVKAVIWLVGKTSNSPWTAVKRLSRHNQTFDNAEEPLFASSVQEHSNPPEDSIADRTSTEWTLRDCLVEALFLTLEPSSRTSEVQDAEKGTKPQAHHREAIR